MRSDKLRIGLIGAGDVVTRFHLGGWLRLKNVEIVGVADIREPRLSEVAEKYSIPFFCADYRRLLDRADIEAVDVTLPNRLHAPATLAALGAGKHVLCEKPLATSPAEVEQMIAASERANRLLCVMQNLRYRGDSQAIRRWIAAGGLGEPYYVRAWALRRNYLPCAPGFICRDLSGGGVCMDMGVHTLDLAMYLLDFPEPVAVAGAMGAHLAKSHLMPGGWGEWDRSAFDVEDFACGLVRFENGMRLSLEASWLAHIPERENVRLEILGTQAGVRFPGGHIATVTDGQLADTALEPLPELERTHWMVIEQFADAVLNGRPSPVPAWQSLKVIRILDGIYRSQAQGCEVAV